MFNPISNDLENRLILHNDWVASLGEHGVRLQVNHADWTQLDFSSRNLQEADLFAMRFNQVRLQAVDLYAAMLGHCKFEETDMSYANLTKADITASDFSSCNLNNVNAFRTVFAGSTFYNVSFSSATLAHAYMGYSVFRKVRFEGTNLRNVSFNETLFEDIVASQLQGIDEVYGNNVRVVQSNSLTVFQTTEEFRIWLRRINH